MSQSELAELLDVSRQTISKWECNICDPEAGRIKQMATIFKVTTDYLLDNKTNNEIVSNNNKHISKRIRISKEYKISIILGVFALAFIVYTLAYCYAINPATYHPENGTIKYGLLAHILSRKEFGYTGITLMLITIIILLAFVFHLLITILRKRKNKTC